MGISMDTILKSGCSLAYPEDLQINISNKRISKPGVEPGVAAYNCNLSTQEIEAGRSPQVQGWPVLHNEFQASMEYSGRPCLEINKYVNQH